MSWEDQGRQYHAWFGHGTAGVASPVGGDPAKGAVEAVALGAMGRLSGARRAEFARYLSRGGAAELGVLLPAWAGRSRLEGDAFRRQVVGAVLNAGAAGAALRAGRAYGAGNLAGAGLALAEVIVEGGPNWRYGVRWIRDSLMSEGVTEGVGGSSTPSTPILIADNQRENRMVRDVAVILKLDKDQAQRLHREISGEGYDFQEILQIGREMFDGR